MVETTDSSAAAAQDAHSDELPAGRLTNEQFLAANEGADQPQLELALRQRISQLEELLQS